MLIHSFGNHDCLFSLNTLGVHILTKKQLTNKLILL